MKNNRIKEAGLHDRHVNAFSHDIKSIKRENTTHTHTHAYKCYNMRVEIIQVTIN